MASRTSGVVVLQGLAHGPRVPVPARRRVLDVREQEGDQRAGGRRRGRRRRVLPVERGVLREHRPLQAGQFGTGEDAELVGQDLAEPLVGAQGLGLAAAAVEGPHELAPQRLAQRGPLDEVAQLADEGAVLPEGQAGLDRALDRGPALLLQLAGPRPGEGLVGELGQRGVAAPAAERLGRRGRGVGPPAGLERLPGPAGGVLEREGVQLVHGAPQCVARAGVEVDAVAPEDRAQPGHLGLEVVGRVDRGRIGPQRVHQDVARHDLVRPHREQRRAGSGSWAPRPFVSLPPRSLRGARELVTTDRLIYRARRRCPRPASRSRSTGSTRCSSTSRSSSGCSAPATSSSSRRGERGSAVTSPTSGGRRRCRT